MTADAAPTTVVVAEDNELLRQGIVALLAKTPGIRMLGEAASGLEAVRLVGRLGPDVAVVDIRMPGIDGVEVTKRILASKNCRTAVVVLTTYDDDESVFSALRAGAQGFVVKDAPTDELVRAIRAARSGEAVLSPRVARRVVRAALGRSPVQASDSFAQLSVREKEVLELVAAGMSNEEIAHQLTVSVPTVKSHVSSLLTKTGSRSRIDLVIAVHRR